MHPFVENNKRMRRRTTRQVVAVLIAIWFVNLLVILIGLPLLLWQLRRQFADWMQI